MRRRLYFVLPNIKSARVMMDELLHARIGAEYIHFLARPDKPLGDLPEASILEKTDIVYCGEIGLLLGAGMGLLAGILAVIFPPWFGPVPLIVIPFCVIIGALASALWTGLLATTIPNSRVETFRKQIDQGCVLMIVSTPLNRVREVRDLLTKTHPEAAYGGTWPADHTLFP